MLLCGAGSRPLIETSTYGWSPVARPKTAASPLALPPDAGAQGDPLDLLVGLRRRRGRRSRPRSLAAIVVAAEGAGDARTTAISEHRRAAADHDQPRLRGESPLGAARVGPGGSREAGAGAAARSSRPPAAARLAGQPGQLGAGNISRRRSLSVGGERVVGGVVAQVARGVGAPDRVGLAEQVVGEPDVAIGVGAAELGQRRAGAGADLGLLDWPSSCARSS